MSEVNNLPINWIWAKLNDIGKVSSGGTPSTKDENNFIGNIAWITPADLSGYNGKFISKGQRNISEKGLNSSSAVLLPKGTILFSSRAPIGYVVIASNDISTNQGFKNLTVSENIFDEYVYYYLKANKELAEKYASGTTFLEISGSKFAQLPIPIPPLTEQHRIVAKIEELFTKLDAGVESLKKAKVQLKQYRQAVLKNAFEGKLTEEWRKYHKSEILIASNEINQVIKSKQKGNKKFNDVKNEEIRISDLPYGWTYGKLENLIYIAGRIGWRGLKAEEYTQEGPLFLSVYNLNYGDVVDFSNSYHINEERYIESPEIQLQNNDMLLVKDGAGIGKRKSVV